MPTIKIDNCGQGVNKDLLPSELSPGMWSDASNFRFRKGFAEKWEGATSVLHTTSPSFGAGTTVQPLWFDVYNTTDAASSYPTYVVYSDTDKVYVTAAGGANHYNITRLYDSIFISSITNVTTTATVTTSSAHGLSNGNQIVVYGASPSAYNGTFSVTVTSTTTFTYTMLSDPGGSATTVGVYYRSSPNTKIDFTGVQADRWTSGTLGGIFVLNNPVDGLYYWSGDTSASVKRIAAMGSMKAHTARVFKNYIVLLNTTESSVAYTSRVRWSDAAEPGALPTTFTAASTNDAGFVDLADAGGDLVDCLPLGESLIIYKSDSRYAMQYVGGNDVFRFTRLPGVDGLINRHCVVDTPVGHVFMTRELEVKVHQGGTARSISDGRIRSYLKNVANNFEYYSQYIFMARNDDKSEVFIGLYSGATSTVGLLWNWEEDTWAILDYGTPEIVFGTSALFPNSSNATTTEKRLLLLATTTIPTIGGSPSGAGDVGTSDYYWWFRQGATEGTLFDVSLTGALERTGIHLDDRDTFKTIHRSRWNIDGDAADTATIYHGSSKTADGTTTYTSGTTYTIGTTDYADGRATAGRFGAIKLSTTAYPMKIRSIDLDVTGGGKR